MPKEKTISRCSSGRPLNFRWYGSPAAPLGRDLAVVLKAFESIFSQRHLIINDFNLLIPKMEIRRRIERAMEGSLKPLKHIKVVNGKKFPTLYEIRWQNIPVREILENGQVRSTNLLFRMYHSEPDECPDYFIAHNIHEKDISVQSEIKVRQNREINIARKYFELGVESRWGIMS